ncbi:MAG: phage portal protein [Gammaproteobacteria bacterium]|nr:phage portal protein [Gammaproteobacteria bacterium]
MILGKDRALVARLKDALETAQERLAVEQRNYTDLVTQALVDATQSTQGAYVSALETAAGSLSRAFASATVSGPGAAMFTPWVMAQIGRSLVEDGDSVWYRAGVALIRAEQYSQPDGDQTMYQLATRGVEIMVDASRVFHARWNIDVASLRGVGPLNTARTLRSMLSKLEASLDREQNAPVGYILPVPADGNADVVTALKSDLAGLDGRLAVAETLRGGWGDGPAGSPRREFEPQRLGPSVPEGNVALYKEARNAVLAACGYPISLALDGDGTGQREAWRRYLHGTVAPLGRLVALEAERIGLPVTIDFDQLFASDIAGRARAFQSLVGGGMDIAAAAAAAGLLEREEP